ncbi:MAG: F0F1 ATP synthase subunit A [Pseudomonadota bacterium]|nr:F0F1 ATP synthase subunit A [Pseudomonadota bacterium]
MAANLLEEFEIHHISLPLFHVGSHVVSFTNSSLWMLVSVIASAVLMMAAMHPQAIVPGRWQMAAETLYNMVTNMVRDAAGDQAKPFFPFIFTIFIFIFFCNTLGLIPYTLPVTAHIIINFSIAVFLFLVITITGFVKHGTHFLHLFVPQGVPKAMLPFMVVIELVSFAVRPFSLSTRLFANMLAGHLLLIVFGSLTAGLLAAHWLAGLSILPLAINVAITGFEFFVAFLQAYIYTILAAVYLRDALEMH